MGVFGQADGSAYLEQGNTKVLAAVYGPHDMSRGSGSSTTGSWSIASTAWPSSAQVPQLVNQSIPGLPQSAILLQYFYLK